MTVQRDWLMVAVLGSAILVSAIAVVYTKYLTRTEFVRLQDARYQRDALDIEWGRLRLEEASLTTHNRIEETARQVLDMHLPRGAEARLLEIPNHGSR